MPKNKIAVYNEKGRVGKTPLSLEIALRLGYNYATNQNRPRKDIENIIPDGEFLQVGPNEAFPQLDDDFPVVFDLAGELVGYERSIVSALEQVDLIIVPVVNEADAIMGTAYAITEIKTLDSITADFVVVANMLKKPSEAEEVAAQLIPLIGEAIPIIPIRYSKAFDRILSEGTSIRDLVEQGGLYAWSFRNVNAEIDKLMSYISK
jgi:MinD-like ATPase involved in chromosome partitioning or flagellar assembly